jgi:hypothetical protein
MYGASVIGALLSIIRSMSIWTVPMILVPWSATSAPPKLSSLARSGYEKSFLIVYL